jgi:hypothetical protein
MTGPLKRDFPRERLRATWISRLASRPRSTTSILHFISITQRGREKHIAEMCKFEYRVYEYCLHLGIELSNFCPKVLFEAGMTGVLKPCEEEKYRTRVLTTPVRLSNMTEFTSFAWTEIKDLCEKCQLEHQVRWGLYWAVTTAQSLISFPQHHSIPRKESIIANLNADILVCEARECFALCHSSFIRNASFDLPYGRNFATRLSSHHYSYFLPITITASLYKLFAGHEADNPPELWPGP